MSGVEMEKRGLLILRLGCRCYFLSAFHLFVLVKSSREAKTYYITIGNKHSARYSNRSTCPATPAALTPSLFPFNENVIARPIPRNTMMPPRSCVLCIKYENKLEELVNSNDVLLAEESLRRRK